MSTQIPLETMDCARFIENPDECPIEIRIINSEDPTLRRQVAQCGVDCHLVQLVPSKQNASKTDIHFTGCHRVIVMLKEIFGATKFEDESDLLSSYSAEFRTVGICRISVPYSCDEVKSLIIGSGRKAYLVE